MSDFRLPITCEQFDARVSDYIDGTLSVSDRAVMDAHASQCVRCAATLADVAAIAQAAGVMPLLTPSRDLWSGIATRLDTPVVSIASAGTQNSKMRRTFSFRALAAAAAALVAVSSGATYVLTRASVTGISAPPVASATASPTVERGVTARPTATPPAAPATGANANAGVVARNTVDNNESDADVGFGNPRARTRYASNGSNSVEVVYEREITAMRRIVDERLVDLDSTTVIEIERNLRIIDKAISDSRRALQNDPRSRFLSTQLDRALENKLDVLRRIALL